MPNAKRRRLFVPALLAAALTAPNTVPVAASTSPLSPTDEVQAVAAGRSAIYGGGPFYSDGQAVMNTLRASGFTTVVLWSIHVRTTATSGTTTT